MPVFVMGILSGLQRIREADKEDFTDENLSKNFVHDILPWGLSSCGEIDQENKENKWRWRVERSSFIIIMAILYVFFIRFNPVLHAWCADNFLFVHLQLLLVQGLTYDGERSFFGKLLRTKLCTFLGSLHYS